MADNAIRTLENLAKLSRQKVEDQQKVIAQIRQRMAPMRERITHFEQSIESELRAAEADPTLHDLAIKYLHRAKAGIKSLQTMLAPLEVEEDKQQNVLADLFAEQKRYEIMLETKLKEQARRRQLKAQSVLDEVAADRKRRKDENG